MNRMKKSHISNILRTNRTVFTFKDIMLESSETDLKLLKRRVNYYVKTGDFYHIRRGIYAKDKNYNKFELAAKIYTPSYISFETVLSQEGIVFQGYSRIFIASYLVRDIVCDNQVYSYRKIKNSILTNNIGIENKEYYSIAAKERAFLDVLYLNKDYHFDNLSPINWEKAFEMLPIYQNKRMSKKADEYYKDFRANK